MQATRQAFDELEAAFRALSEDFQHQGHDVPISIKRRGLCFALGACGWWLIFTWAQRASNVIEDARLNVEKYGSHPPFPGVVAIEPAHRLGIEQFGFGLVALDEARWIERGNWERSFTSMDLATKILTDLLQRPNTTLR